MVRGYPPGMGHSFEKGYVPWRPHGEKNAYGYLYTKTNHFSSPFFPILSEPMLRRLDKRLWFKYCEIIKAPGHVTLKGSLRGKP